MKKLFLILTCIALPSNLSAGAAAPVLAAQLAVTGGAFLGPKIKTGLIKSYHWAKPLADKALTKTFNASKCVVKGTWNGIKAGFHAIPHKKKIAWTVSVPLTIGLAIRGYYEFTRYYQAKSIKNYKNDIHEAIQSKSFSNESLIKLIDEFEQFLIANPHIQAESDIAGFFKGEGNRWKNPKTVDAHLADIVQYIQNHHITEQQQAPHKKVLDPAYYTIDRTPVIEHYLLRAADYHYHCRHRSSLGFCHDLLQLGRKANNLSLIKKAAALWLGEVNKKSMQEKAKIVAATTQIPNQVKVERATRCVPHLDPDSMRNPSLDVVNYDLKQFALFLEKYQNIAFLLTNQLASKKTYFNELEWLNSDLANGNNLKSLIPEDRHIFDPQNAARITLERLVLWYRYSNKEEQKLIMEIAQMFGHRKVLEDAIAQLNLYTNSDEKGFDININFL